MDTIRPGRHSGDNSVLFPILPRPPKLDGSHAGDFGFDPLGFTENFDLYYLQESEVRHARLAMLAVVGWPLGEMVGPSFLKAGPGSDLAPSILNGHLLTNPLNLLFFLGVFGGLGFFEYVASEPRAANEAWRGVKCCYAGVASLLVFLSA